MVNPAMRFLFATLLLAACAKTAAGTDAADTVGDLATAFDATEAADTPAETSPPPLGVNFEAPGAGTLAVDQATVRLFKTGQDGKPTCDDLPFDALPPAAATSPATSVFGAAWFATLPDLETDKTQKYTVTALATLGTDPAVKAWGCNDRDGNVTLGASTLATVELYGQAPKLAGKYELDSTLDLVDGAPASVQAAWKDLAGFLLDPVGQLALLSCDATLDPPVPPAFCGFLFQDAAHPDLNQLGPLGTTVIPMWNGLLIGLLQSQCPYPAQPQVCTQVLGLTDLATRLPMRLVSTLTCDQEPGPSGEVPAGGCQESWDLVTVPWVDFGVLAIQFGQPLPFPGGTPAPVDVTLVSHGWNHDLSIAPRGRTVDLAALLGYAIVKDFVPGVFGDGSDGLPAVDTFEDLVAAILAGRPCLMDQSCCDTFASNVMGNLPSPPAGLTADLLSSSCTALRAGVAARLGKDLAALGTASETLTLGTPAGKACPAHDRDADLMFDTLGDAARPCAWDVTLDPGTGPYGSAGTFTGVRSAP